MKKPDVNSPICRSRVVIRGDLCPDPSLFPSTHLKEEIQLKLLSMKTEEIVVRNLSLGTSVVVSGSRAPDTQGTVVCSQPAM